MTEPSRDNTNAASSSSAGIQGADGTRYLAIAGGVMHGQFVREYLRQWNQAGQDFTRMHYQSLARLQDKGLITPGEARDLSEIMARGKKLASGSVTDEHLGEAASAVRAVHHRLVDTQASPLAILSSSIAMETLTDWAMKPKPGDGGEEGGTTVYGSTDPSVLDNDLEGLWGGAGIGATIGAAVGGEAAIATAAVGAILGGIIGAIVGSAATAANQAP